jgi:ATP-dependent DNA helicase PIF1
MAAINRVANDRITFRTADGRPAKRIEKLSLDTVLEVEEQKRYPQEFLNALEFPDMPLHKLDLQEGAPVILLRTLAGGFAKGMRLIISSEIGQNLLTAVVASGPLRGETVFLPRLVFTSCPRTGLAGGGVGPGTDEMAFTLSRRQYPVKPAFAMTIEESQGKGLECIGIYFRTEVIDSERFNK